LVSTVSPPVGGVLFPGPLRGSGSVTIHLCGPPEGPSEEGRTVRSALCLALLPVGVADPAGSPRPLVRSYRTVSPLPVPGEPGHRRSAFCCPVREVAPAWLSPAPLSCGAPTFLSPLHRGTTDRGHPEDSPSARPYRATHQGSPASPRRSARQRLVRAGQRGSGPSGKRSRPSDQNRSRAPRSWRPKRFHAHTPTATPTTSRISANPRCSSSGI